MVDFGRIVIKIVTTDNAKHVEEDLVVMVAKPEYNETDLDY